MAGDNCIKILWTFVVANRTLDWFAIACKATEFQLNVYLASIYAIKPQIPSTANNLHGFRCDIEKPSSARAQSRTVKEIYLATHRHPFHAGHSQWVGHPSDLCREKGNPKVQPDPSDRQLTLTRWDFPFQFTYHLSIASNLRHPTATKEADTSWIKTNRLSRCYKQSRICRYIIGT